MQFLKQLAATISNEYSLINQTQTEDIFSKS